MLGKILVITTLYATFGLTFAAGALPPPEAFTYELTKPDQNSLEVTVVGTFDIDTGPDGTDGVQGWVWGVCHNPAEASIGDCAGLTLQEGCDPETCPEVTCPEDVLNPAGHGEVFFHIINIFPNGISQAVVLDSNMSYTLGRDDSPFEMLSITYTLAHGVDSTQLEFCGTLGEPESELFVVVNGETIYHPPENLVGITIGRFAPIFRLENLEAGKGPGVRVLLDTDQDQEVGGFQFGVALDNSDAKIDEIVPGSAVVEAGGADYFESLNVYGGATLGCVLSFEPEFRTLSADTPDQEVAVIKLGCRESVNEDISVTVSLSGKLGTPPVDIIIDSGSGSYYPNVGTPVTVEVPTGMIPFLRGDVNQNGSRSISDAVGILMALFGMGGRLPLIEECMDSADVNDNGSIGIEDAVYLLGYLFNEGEYIPAPADICGADPTPDDSLNCLEYICP